MKLITTTQSLQDFCKKARKSDFIAVDTEFLREKTYYPILCLIQIGCDDGFKAIDPLADDIDLSCFYELLRDPSIKKVMHGCRQDLEIFYKEMGELPNNVFDTQIAGMVCGFGESISYKGLVEHYTDGTIDKSQRFTDWSIRPLSDKQIDYALDDVIYLYELYPMMREEIEKQGRMPWIDEEMSAILDVNLYDPPLDEAWLKVKNRLNKPKHLAVLREVAAWREERAQKKDLPRGRVMRDDALVEIAVTTPKDMDALLNIRGISGGFEKSDSSTDLLERIQKGKECKKADCPKKEKKKSYPAYLAPSIELLKVLLKKKSDEYKVASRLIIEKEDLYELAMKENPKIPALKGWRREVFGDDALALKKGEIAFTLTPKGRMKLIRTDSGKSK